MWLLLVGSLLAATTFDKDSLVQRLDEAKVKNVHEAVDLIAMEQPGLLRNHILVHNSMSCQGSSFRKPRALLVSDDGTFAVTFTNQRPANHALEVMQYHDAKRGFGFYDVDFDKKKPEEGDAVDVKDHFHLTQPADCLRCHGGSSAKVPGKAVMGIAGFFANMYGSYRDRLLVGSLESDQYLGFLKIYKGRPGYRNLLGLPLADDLQKLALVHLDYPVHTTEPAPAARFLKELDRLNGTRILSMIEQHPRREKIKYATLAAFMDCEGIEKYLPGGAEKPYATYLAEVRYGMNWGFTTNFEMYSESNPVLELPNWHLKHAERVAKLRWVLEPGADFDIDDWSMDNLDKAYAFGEESGDSPLVRILPKVGELLLGEAWATQTCATLKTASLRVTATK